MMALCLRTSPFAVVRTEQGFWVLRVTLSSSLKLDVLDPRKHSLLPRTYHSHFSSTTARAHGLPSSPGTSGSEGQVQMVIPGPAMVCTTGLYTDGV